MDIDINSQSNQNGDEQVEIVKNSNYNIDCLRFAGYNEYEIDNHFGERRYLR